MLIIIILRYDRYFHDLLDLKDDIEDFKKELERLELKKAETIEDDNIDFHEDDEFKLTALIAMELPVRQEECDTAIREWKEGKPVQKKHFVFFITPVI